jgi:hypothetical protein
MTVIDAFRVGAVVEIILAPVPHTLVPVQVGQIFVRF